jgi:hypothetical protein
MLDNMSGSSKFGTKIVKKMNEHTKKVLSGCFLFYR